MAPFIDSDMNDLMVQYYNSDCDLKFLYGGSQENIVRELHAWVARRKEITRTQHELHMKMIDVALELEKSGPETPQERRIWAEGDRNMERGKALEDEYREDSARATYLLRTLKHRGILWPKLWWRPDHDGGICSFLGTVDPTFDPDTMLVTLQDVEGMELLKAKLDNFQSLVDAGILRMTDEEENDSWHDSTARIEKNIEEGRPIEMKREIMGKPLTPASATNPAKWTRFVKAVRRIKEKPGLNEDCNAVEHRVN